MAPLREEYKAFLFGKHILVHEDYAPGTVIRYGQNDSRLPRLFADNDKYVGQTLLSFSKLLNIRITSGKELARPAMVEYAAYMLGEDVPAAFYQGFPKSVRKLSSDHLLADQIISYFATYGMNDFSKARHSIFETDADLEREVFKEAGTVKDFEIISEDEAAGRIISYVKDMFSSTRPLSDAAFQVAVLALFDYDIEIGKIASKNTAVRLYMETGMTAFTKDLYLSDTIKLLEQVHFEQNMHARPTSLRFQTNQLNLKNKHRKLITKLIDQCFASGHADVKNCYEKKKTWAGLLHHIHYQAKTEDAKAFLSAMRGKENHSAYSEFEAKLQKEGAIAAAEFLLQEKGPGALLRSLNYLASRCRSEEEIDELIRLSLDTEKTNPIILLQLLCMYSSRERTGRLGRTFQFVKSNLLRVHHETKEEEEKRRSDLSDPQSEKILGAIQTRLQSALSGRLGRVYIHPEMERYGVPIKESASQGGLGVLASGSRVPIGEHRKIRGFTYWEKVDDIDLSVIGLDEKGKQTEFSWRTMAENQNDAITYSGDQTSGYDGGSEYYDIIVPDFRKTYPETRYLVFCDNVYSNLTFDRCICRAGFMVRDEEDSGEIFEPKTVASSFTVNAPGRFSYLFGIDLMTHELVWMNLARDADASVAGTTGMGFLIEKFHITEYLNLKILFTMLAKEVVSDPKEADVLVVPSSYDAGASESKDDPVSEKKPEIIREYDFEKILSLIEK